MSQMLHDTLLKLYHTKSIDDSYIFLINSVIRRHKQKNVEADFLFPFINLIFMCLYFKGY